MNFSNFKIGIRSGMGFAIILVFMMLIMIVGISNMGKIHEQLDRIYNQNYARIALANQMKISIDEIYIEMRSIILLPEQKVQQEALKRIESHRAKYGKAFDTLNNIDQSNEGKRLLANLQINIVSAKSSNNQWLELALANTTSSAIPLLEKECEPKRLIVEQTLLEVIKYQESQIKIRFDEANSEYFNARLVIFVLGFVAFLFGIFAAIFLTRSISKPVVELLKIANTASSGDLTVEIPVNSRDEIGQLAQALKLMVNNTRELVGQIGAKASTVTISSQQLNLNAQQSASTANETAATMSEIAGTVTQVASNIQDVSSSSIDANNHAQQGIAGIKRVTMQMQKIADSANVVADGINSLSIKSQEITQIVELITSIADQTNLLALNAAIEAGRAGEQGRGFAVVAEEVRKLAEQSAQAAKEIKVLINSIQNESRSSVDSMDASAEEVATGSQVVLEVGESFKQIIRAIQELSNLIQEAASATQQSSAGVQQVAATTEEQTAAMQEVSASAETSASLAEDLNAMVGRFKT